VQETLVSCPGGSVGANRQVHRATSGHRASLRPGIDAEVYPDLGRRRER
jgi:hypothetical protein